MQVCFKATKTSKKTHPVLLAKAQTYSRRMTTVVTSPLLYLNQADCNDIGDPASLADGIGAEGDSSSESNLSGHMALKERAAAKPKTKVQTRPTKAKKATQSLNSPAPSGTPGPATRHSVVQCPICYAYHICPTRSPEPEHPPSPPSCPTFLRPDSNNSHLASMSTSTTSTPAAMLRIECLWQVPMLFASNETILTNAYASLVTHPQSQQGMGHMHWCGPSMVDSQRPRVVQGDSQVEAKHSARAAGKQGGVCGGTDTRARAGI